MSGFGDRLASRQKDFKKGVDADEARRKREDAAVQLRKQTKDEALFKKRMVNEGEFSAEACGADAGDERGMDTAGQATSQVAGEIVRLKQLLMSNDPEAVLSATQQYRKLLSVEVDPPIADVINAGIVQRFVELLKEVSAPMLQFEAAWVLTNIASGTAEQTKVVVEHGALPLFVGLLQSPNDDVREQAVWALGNIAGDGPNFRDLVLQSGGLVPVMQLFSDGTKISMMRNATWALSNLMRGKPPPTLEWVVPALPTLHQLLNSSDSEVLTDAAWALSYLSDGADERIQAVVQSGVCQRLVELLSHPSSLVQTPALRAAGNVVTGNDEQTQAMLQFGLLTPLATLLQHEKRNIVKESCWTVSNITAGNRAQIQEVINANLLPLVIRHLATGDFDVKKEAAWVISNATAGGSPEQIEYLVQCGCIQPMVDLMSVSDVKIVGVVLDAMENILRTGQLKQAENGLPENPIVALIEQADGLAKIEACQEDPNEQIYQKAMHLLEKYFPIEDAEGDIADAPATDAPFGAAMPEGGFNFKF